MTFGEDHDEDDCDCEGMDGVQKGMLALKLATQKILVGEFPNELPERLAILISAVIGVTCSAIRAREQALEAFQDEEEVDQCTATMLNDVMRAATHVAMNFVNDDRSVLNRLSIN